MKDQCTIISNGAESAWENRRHFATPRTVSTRNDVWGTSAEIPYWWRVTTQIWVMLLIGWSKFHKRHEQIRSSSQVWVATHHQTKYGISVLVSQTSFRGETSGGIARNRLFSQASAILDYRKCIQYDVEIRRENYYEHEWSARAALVKRFLLLINAYNYTAEPR